MDLLKILRESLYSKYKADKKNFYIAQINSILFKNPIKNSNQYIRFHFREMVYLSDFEEYFQKYSYKDSILKLKILGYIYANNFKPPPNYLSFDYNIYITMCKLLKEKQNLIDRNISNNLILYERQKNEKDNKYLYNKENKKNDKYNNIMNSISFSKSSLNSNINKNQSFEKNYIYELANSKNKIKLFSSNEKYNGTKYENKIKDNSTDSIVTLIKQFKSRNISNIIDTKIKNIQNKNKRYLLNTKTEKRIFNKGKLPTKKAKTIFISSNKIFYNKNKSFELIKNLRKENNKENHLSVNQFKEKLKENKTIKIKEYINNYWKTNKDFIKNLIKNKNDIINYNKICFSQNSQSGNSRNNNFLSTRNSLSSKSVKNKKISFNKFKLIKKGKKPENNSLIMKIQNDSNFMKNKNYSSIFQKKNNNSRNAKLKKNIFDKHINHKNYNNNIKNDQNSIYRIMEAYSVINNNKLF